MIQTLPPELLAAEVTAAEIDVFLSRNTCPLVHDSVVTFLYRGPGDHVELRHWIYGLPASISMWRVGDTDLWQRAMEFPAGSRIEYKFGVRHGGHEQWIHDPLNPQVAHDPFGGNSVVHCSGYEVPEWIRRRPDVAAGRMESLEVASAAFGDRRRIDVYLPPGFREYRRYRLLVVHDGDDYVRYSSLDTVLDNLIDRLEIPPLIVALTNPSDRLREYADDPRHARHIVEELIPALEARYPLIGETSGRCIMGASFGGVASLSTAWRYPGTFDSLLLQSGSFAFTDIGDHPRGPVFDPVVRFMNTFRERPGEPARRAFLSCGVYESLIYENRSMAPFLQAHDIDVRLVEARDGHNWENWRDRLQSGLTWIFPGPLWVTYM